MIIPDEMKDQVREELKSLNKKVVLRVFTEKKEAGSKEKNQSCCSEPGEQHSCCGGHDHEEVDYSKETVELLQSIAELNSLIQVEVFDMKKNFDQAKKHNVEQAPAILVHGENDFHPIRFYGIPAGYEFSSLIESLKYVGAGVMDISDEVKSKAKSIKTKKELKVFVTPSCPYCPPAVTTAFQFALANPEFISASMIEASEFIDLSTQFDVRSVPKIVINNGPSFEGALPAEEYIERVLNS